MSKEEIMQGINKTIAFMKEELNAEHSCFSIKELWALNGLLDLYNKEKEKNKKVIDYIEKNKEKFKNLDYAYPEAVINHFNKINNILKEGEKK